MKEWGQKQTQVLIGKSQAGGEEEEAPPEEETKVSQNVPNLLADFSVFEQCGIHFGEEEVFLQ